jgi:hypothetical protein
MLSGWKIIAIAALVSCSACADPPPPKLVVVPTQSQLFGHPGLYFDGTIYLAPGATWDVLQHEIDHHRYGSLGEIGAVLRGR